MSRPSPSDVHVDEVLTGFSIAYLQSTDEFIAGKVFPTIKVKKQSDKIAKFKKGSFQKDQMQKRAPGTKSSGGGWEYEFDTYFCDVYAHHKLIDNQTRANADSWASLDKATSEWLTRIKLIRREKDFVANYFTGGIWTLDLDGVASGEDNVATLRRWNDPASTPVEDVRKLKRRVHLASTVRPNTMTLGREVYDVLVDHPDILSRIKTTSADQPAQVTKRILAALFEVDEILIMDAIEDIAEEGQTPSMAYIGGNHMLLSYRPKGDPTLMSIMSGATLEWVGDNAFTPGIASWWDRDTKSDKYEIEDAWDQKIMALDAAAFVADIIG